MHRFLDGCAQKLHCSIRRVQALSGYTSIENNNLIYKVDSLPATVWHQPDDLGCTWQLTSQGGV